MTYKVQKLTKQYTGYSYFKYVIQPDVFGEKNARNQLCELREWCHQTWGPSRELVWSIDHDKDAKWCWNTEFKQKRIYLKSDAELVLFELKWQK
jgi:hypothetical protein